MSKSEATGPYVSGFCHSTSPEAHLRCGIEQCSCLHHDQEDVVFRWLHGERLKPAEQRQLAGQLDKRLQIGGMPT